MDIFSYPDALLGYAIHRAFDALAEVTLKEKNYIVERWCVADPLLYCPETLSRQPDNGQNRPPQVLDSTRESNSEPIVKHTAEPAMVWVTLSRQCAGARQDARPADAKHMRACTHEQRCISLLDLPKEMISSVLRHLPTKSKCQAELVCRTFREVLSNPTPRDFVWNILDLNDSIFQRVPLNVLNRQACSNDTHIWSR